MQFVPVYTALTGAAMREAETQDLDGVPLHVVSSDYLAAVALSTGRPKGFVRVLALLEAGTSTSESLATVVKAHGLDREWREFRKACGSAARRVSGSRRPCYSRPAWTSAFVPPSGGTAASTVD